jgi:hypothetical protein
MEIKEALKQIESSRHEYSKRTSLAIDTLIRHYFNAEEMLKEDKANGN